MLVWAIRGVLLTTSETGGGDGGGGAKPSDILGVKDMASVLVSSRFIGVASIVGSVESVTGHGCTGVMYVVSGYGALLGKVTVSVMVMVSVTKTTGEVSTPVQAVCSDVTVVEGTTLPSDMKSEDDGNTSSPSVSLSSGGG